MALCTQITCRQCGLPKEVWYSPADSTPEVCGACREQNAEAKKKAELDRIAALPLEERLRRVEEWIYDYRPQYVAPPRF